MDSEGMPNSFQNSVNVNVQCCVFVEKLKKTCKKMKKERLLPPLSTTIPLALRTPQKTKAKANTTSLIIDYQESSSKKINIFLMY